MKEKITFTLQTETKGAFRYQETDGSGQPRRGDSQGAVVGTLYIRKRALDGAAPDTLTVELSS